MSSIFQELKNVSKQRISVKYLLLSLLCTTHIAYSANTLPCITGQNTTRQKQLITCLTNGFFNEYELEISEAIYIPNRTQCITFRGITHNFDSKCADHNHNFKLHALKKHPEHLLLGITCIINTTKEV